MKKKNKKTKSRKAFTIVEIVTVVTIIAILVGILLPAITTVRKVVLDTKQQAQITTIALAIQAFKNEYGRYPESDYRNLSINDYSGAQMLSEALLGWDLMGFHPKSEWESNGRINNRNDELYELALDSDPDVRKKNLEERIGPYLELSNTTVYHLGDYFDKITVTDLEYDKTYVISDVYKHKKIKDRDTEEYEKVGLPVLYFKAFPERKQMSPDVPIIDSIYDQEQNIFIFVNMKLQDLAENIKRDHPLIDPALFYDFIENPKISKKTGRPWPYNPDSYLLISAGNDGLYGTKDDITNFK
ncbi:MAG: type II secretion system protein [Sedimentisphaerales bacterium]|nr:type II secretion system protein [Sedimentisphaerales bacterium]